MSQLIKFETRSEFESFITTNSGLPFEEALNVSNNGVYGSIVLINDTDEIYANGKLHLPEISSDPDPSNQFATITYVNNIVGDINSILDDINNEVV